MRQRGIPRDVEAFIAAHLKSVAQLEILLLLHGQPSQPLSPLQVGETLRIDPQWAAAELERLQQRGLFTADEQGSYTYAPASQELGDAVDGLARAFSTHRVSVITMIFSTPSDSVGSFADAFKIRRDKDG